MAKISGYLKDGAGQAVAECIIILSALKTSNQVIEQIESYTTTKDGFYEINALTGQYKVTLTIAGHPPKKVGVITVYSDSANGTLNDFLANGTTNDDITPLLLSQLIEERKQAQDAATSAQKSATEASTTLVNTVKKTGESSQTVNGILSVETLQESGKRVYSPNNKPTASDISALSISGGTLTGELTSTKDSALRFKNLINRISSIIRFDGARLWVLFTNRDDPDGNFNELRPIGIHSGTGNIDIGHSLTIKSIPVLKQGDYGLGAETQKNTYAIDLDTHNFETGFYSGNVWSTSKNKLPFGNSSSTDWFYLINQNLASSGNKYKLQILGNAHEQRLAFRNWIAGAAKPFVEFVTTGNSTIDSNGFYKKASPVVRLVDPTCQVAIAACVEDNLQQAGDGFANDQASGVQIKYLAVGHYEVHGSLGFAKSGWYIETPQDANGNKKLFVTYDTDQNNVITVRTYQNCFENGRFVAGEPMDIPDGRWIDIRLLMSETSTD